ncbi:BON domain-containing protein [Neochlamydia sp. S13]|uniref:BON domain-containing protein n=1 Tax=Neochlamydia sp. S13 TaxID=1353976 RepID=UPI000693455F|nr:BON domain-containing protein [Neochlamydia sp. S13]BBI17124.1 hypothetical protein NCS13_1_0929 [Neochlamydia sp. S13]
MKNLFKLSLATMTVLAGASMLHAQAVTSQEGLSNLEKSSYLNSAPSQTEIKNSSVNTSGVQTPGHSAGQTYTQPSNLPRHSDAKISYSETKKTAAWTDGDISQKIRWAIKDDKKLSSYAKTAEVSVNNGNVIIAGSVNNEDEKNHIASIARQVPGVKSVSNNLVIANSK